MQLISEASAEKLRGAYYTPPTIASFILRWGINGGSNADVLEPSCGDGVFLECMRDEQMRFHTATAVEYEEKEAEKAEAIGLRNTEIITGDFHQFCLNTKQRFDLIVGNPPFIRYQYYDSKQQELATKIFKNAGLKRSKLTNAWVTFVIGSTLLLKETGKIGFVLPSELLQVTYAQQVRNFLAQTFNKINIISFENLVFEEIQQEVVILLCEKNGSNEHLIEHIEVKDAEALNTLDPRQLKFPTKKINFHTDKWTYYFLEKNELDLLELIRNSNVPTIKDYADVEVGITTGANNFFTIPKSIVDIYQLQKFAKPMVGRSVQVNSLNFTKQDWQQNVTKEAKAFLLVFPSNAKRIGGQGVNKYLENGELSGVNTGYKTSIRDDWFVIPSIKLSDALFLRRNNIYPKFVLNEAEAYTTDTMHRVFIREGVNKKALIASYYNSISFAFAEIFGRNFGGGCLEMMPSEVENIYLPYNEDNEQLFDQIDQLLREKKTPDEILDITDNILLRERLGLTDEQVKLARSLWHKLIARRLSREALEASQKTNKSDKKDKQIEVLDLFSILEQYPDNIIENEDFLSDEYSDLDRTKNLLVSLVKADNMEQYLDQSAKIYYTGKKFPSTVALNKLYYFMPYIKGKGIKDLYFIKIARVGTRKEGQPDNDPNDIRLVFEIEFVKQLFDDYKKVHLDIWQTFKDTTLQQILTDK